MWVSVWACVPARVWVCEQADGQAGAPRRCACVRHHLGARLDVPRDKPPVSGARVGDVAAAPVDARDDARVACGHRKAVARAQVERAARVARRDVLAVEVDRGDLRTQRARADAWNASDAWNAAAAPPVRSHRMLSETACSLRVTLPRCPCLRSSRPLADSYKHTLTHIWTQRKTRTQTQTQTHSGLPVSTSLALCLSSFSSFP
eukprot:4325551-Pleurochrysis_carterae.AAC.1